MSPRTEDPELRRDKQATIFAAACRVIREKGFHQARMADIAREAGISYGLVYHYYKSKTDLFDALFEEWWQGLDSLIDRLILEDVTVEEKLSDVAAYFLDQYRQRPDLAHLFITEFSRSTANLTPTRLARFKGFMTRTEDIVKQGQVAGRIRSDIRSRHLTFFFLGVLESLLSTLVLDNKPLKSENTTRRLVNSIITVFFEGARPQGG